MPSFIVILKNIIQLLKSRYSGLYRKLSANQIGNKIVTVFINNWINNIAQFVIGVIIVRSFGAYGKGVYSLLLAAAATIGFILSIGLSNGLIYYLKKNTLSTRQAVSQHLLNSFCVMIITVFILTFFKNSLWSILFKDIPYSFTHLLFIILYIPVVLATLFQSSYYLAFHDVKKYLILVAITPIVLMSITWIVTKISPKIESALIVVIVTESIFGIWSYFDIRNRAQTCLQPISVKELYRYSISGHIGGIGNTMMTRADVFLIAAFVNPTALGYYTVARFFYQILLSVPQATNGLLLGVFCDRQPERAIKLNWTVFKLMSALLIVIALPFLLGGVHIITFFYGNDFKLDTLLFNTFIVAALFSGATSSFNSLFLACNKPGITSKVTIIAGTLKTLVSIPLIYFKGIQGAAIATLIGSLILGFLRIFYTIRIRERIDKNE